MCDINMLNAEYWKKWHFRQIWDQKRKINNIDVDSLDQHGKVYDDGR